MRPRIFAFALLPSVLALPLQAAVVLDDEFDDGDPLTNNHGGYAQVGGGYVPVEAGGQVGWGPDADWNWAGTDLQSNDVFAFPTAGQSYRIDWMVGPLAVTTVGAQTWGDIRLQLGVVSANLAQGSASSEQWPITQGLMMAEMLYKAETANGTTIFPGFYAKNDTIGASANGATIALSGHGTDSTISNKVSMVFDDSDMSLYINDVLVGSEALATNSIDAGPGGEYENGWYPAIRGAVADTGRGTMSVERMTIEFIPEPSAALLAAMGGAALLFGSRRRRG